MVIFDMDGVIVETELLWDRAREQLIRGVGGRIVDRSQVAMMGMSADEWSAYMRDVLEVPLSADEINRRVVDHLIELYRAELPLIDGAVEAISAIADRWPIAVASSSDRVLIELVLELAGVADRFAVTVSSNEAGRGKPAPDVFLRAAELLEVAPNDCVVIEDSSNGIKAGVAAGMTVIAIPNRDFPPSPEVVGLAAMAIESIADLTPLVIERAFER